MNTSLFLVLPRRFSGQNKKKGDLGFGGHFPRASLVPRLPWAIIDLPFQGSFRARFHVRIPPSAALRTRSGPLLSQGHRRRSSDHRTPPPGFRRVASPSSSPDLHRRGITRSYRRNLRLSTSNSKTDVDLKWTQKLPSSIRSQYQICGLQRLAPERQQTYPILFAFGSPIPTSASSTDFFDFGLGAYTHDNIFEGVLDPQNYYVAASATSLGQGVAGPVGVYRRFLVFWRSISPSWSFARLARSRRDCRVMRR